VEGRRGRATEAEVELGVGGFGGGEKVHRTVESAVPVKKHTIVNWARRE